MKIHIYTYIYILYISFSETRICLIREFTPWSRGLYLIAHTYSCLPLFSERTTPIKKTLVSNNDINFLFLNIIMVFFLAFTE